jgi:hypothetical protein
MRLQTEHHACTAVAIGFVFDPDFAAMGLDDATRDRESETQAWTDASCTGGRDRQMNFSKTAWRYSAGTPGPFVLDAYCDFMITRPVR